MATAAEIVVQVRIRRLWPLKAALAVADVWPWMGRILVRKSLGLPIGEWRTKPGKGWQPIGHPFDEIIGYPK